MMFLVKVTSDFSLNGKWLPKNEEVLLTKEDFDKYAKCVQLITRLQNLDELMDEIIRK